MLGGGGCGVVWVERDPPCGSSPLAKTFVEVPLARVRATAKQKVERKSLYFFMRILQVVPPLEDGGG